MLSLSVPSGAVAQMALPQEQCRLACLTYEDIRERTVEYNGVTQRLAYSLEDFLEGDFEPMLDNEIVANTECIIGIYARYALGFSEDLQEAGEYPWMMLVSHPYSQADIAVVDGPEGRSILDKAESLPIALREMCYETVDNGWVSIANWGALDPLVEDFAVRFTNTNFSEVGRITPGGEYVEIGTNTQRFLAENEPTDLIESFELEISAIFGPNFPTPGYDRSIFDPLISMGPSWWERDGSGESFGVPLTYFQDIEAREAFRVQVVNGEFRDGQGVPISLLEDENMIYAIDCMGRMYASKVRPTAVPPVVSHGQLLGGAALAVAGDLRADNGVIKHVNVRSGHYEPPPEFLTRTQEFFPEAEFEEAYAHPTLDFFQSWVCETIEITAAKDGTSPGRFGPQDRTGIGEWLYTRRFDPPVVIPVTSPGTSGTLRLEMTVLNGEVYETEFAEYEPLPTGDDYFLSGFSFLPGEDVHFTSIEMQIEGGSGSGSAQLIIDNCPECQEFSEVREENQTQATGQQSKIFYSFDEFVFNARSINPGDQFVPGFDPNFDPSGVANTECITGYYARYVLGFSQEKSDNAEFPWVMLISHPYDQNDAAPLASSIPNKAQNFDAFIEEMCFSPVDSGWISIANWGKIDPTIQGSALRLTNANFSSNGRVTTQGEYLRQGSPSEEFLSHPNIQSFLSSLPLSPTAIYGPHFPVPGYNAGVYEELRMMLPSKWNEDGNTLYLTDPAARSAYQVDYSGAELTYADDGGPVRLEERENPIFVLDCMGNLYASTRSGPQRHSQLLGGGAVAAAGQLYVEDGTPFYLSERSVHYLPPSDLLENMRGVLDPTSFESYWLNPDPNYSANQGWNCEVIELRPKFDGETVRFGSTDPDQVSRRPRRWQIPSTIPLIAGAVTAQATLNIIATFTNEVGLVANMEVEYKAIPGDNQNFYLEEGQFRRTSQFYLPGEPIEAGQYQIFSRIRASIFDGTGDGEALISIDNCQPSNLSTTEVVTYVDLNADPLKAYPNPVKDWLQISGLSQSGGLQELFVTDVNGRPVDLPVISHQGNGNIALGTQALAPGIYYVSLRFDDGTMNQVRVIKR
ncbi:MAG: T9SS type A sorting domain-containing protein [Bacteroidota bacterium]